MTRVRSVGAPLRTALVAVVLLAGCAPGRPARPLDRLSPDSLRALDRAVRLARPAFDRQEDAVRAGIYRAPAPDSAARPAAPAPAAQNGAPPAAAVDPSSRPAPRFVVQVAAYRDRESAGIALAEAARLLPSLSATIEEASGTFRVVVGGWSTAAAAAADLPGIRSIYPSAWVRAASVP